ncbi:MAG: class I SAM-dependent methyltransferase [Phycisphaeraceae bacterium]|nr:MAG: class I SAM-dependent methyltransferase [Phycisphaeraceae bacterium]
MPLTTPHTDSRPQASEIQTLRRVLVERAAALCDARNYRRIALYGAGRHTLPIIRQPWQWHDVQVVAILDDTPRVPSLRGVPVLRPHDLTLTPPGSIHAVVISSETYESEIYERAIRNPALRGIPILRIYSEPAPARPSPADIYARLITRWGLTESDARWLAENRDERHDATLPMLPPERTELHLRRYEFAARYVAGRHVVDAACGTGYGSSLLTIQGAAASVTGIDIDPRATDYATRRFGSPNTRFICASATATGLPANSYDVGVSFETIEHIQDAPGLLNEFARILKPGATLVLSTPNNAGLTKHHVHTFTQQSLGELLSTRFTDIQWHGQWARMAPPASEPAAGIRPVEPDESPEYLIAVATPKK